MPSVLPDSGGTVGTGMCLLLAGLALTVSGASVSVIRRRRLWQQGHPQQADENPQ